MALFGFSDITFSSNASPTKGPLAALQGTKFQKNTFRYPLDLGSSDKSHYMVIYIRQQESTAYGGEVVSDESFNASEIAKSAGAQSQIMGAIQAAQNGKLASHFGQDILNKVNSGLNQINKSTNGVLSGLTGAIGKAAGGVVSGLDNVFGKANITYGGDSAATKAIIDTSIKKITNKSFLQTTQLTTDAIALYMPDTLNYSYTQSYDQLSLGGEMLGQVAAAAQSFADNKGADAGKALVKSGLLNLGKKAADTIGSMTGSSQAAQIGFTAATGKVQNPMLEMLYKSPNFRSFNFEFTFYPRDEKEALEVQRIIERLRFHQAPEMIKDAQGFLVPPSEFDIKFYYAGAQNPNIPPISTCVLQSIDVNYAPNGFSAYEVPGENNPALGRTAMPVAIQLTLQFQETTFLTKEDYRNDRGSGTSAKV